MARQLTVLEREQIAQLRLQGLSRADIGRQLGRHRSTIGRELRRNSDGATYGASTAQQNCQARRRHRPRKLDDEELNAFMRRGLAQCWSPDQIAGSARRRFRQQPRRWVSHTTIYRWIAADPYRRYCISQLNQSLRQLEYRPGTHMVLEPRPVRDAEIVEFQNALKECLAGTFEGTVEADKARFLRIQKLITRLREERTWRDKVTDVRRWFDFAAHELDNTTKKERGYYEDSTGQSGGEKAKLAFTILVAAIAYQYDIDPDHDTSSRFHFVVVDEMFSKVDDQYSEYALELFQKFGLQLLIVAPLDAKALVTEPYVGCYLHVVKDTRSNRSEVFSMTAQEFAEALSDSSGGKKGAEPAPRRLRSR